MCDVGVEFTITGWPAFPASVTPSVCFPMLIMGINDMANGTFTVSEFVLRGPEMGVC